MSTGVQPEQSPSPTAPGATSPSSAAPGSAPSNAPPEFRYPDTPDIPAYARGKTASEVLGITKQLYTTVEQVVSTGRPPQSAPATPQQPAQPPIAEDDYMTGAAFNRLAPQIAQQYVQPQFQQTWDSIAQTNFELVKNDPTYKPIFQKYGHEVLSTLANVDKSLWNVDNLRKVARMVKADHVEEFASELASQRLNEMQSVIRSTGAAPAPVSPQETQYTLKAETLSADFRKRVADAGLTETALDDFLRANGMTRKEWFDGLSKTAITEASR